MRLKLFRSHTPTPVQQQPAVTHPGELRVVTINTGRSDGPYRARIDWLARELAALQPHIVALQEVFRSVNGDVDTAGDLAQRLGMHLAWQPARLKQRHLEGRPITGWSGVALLSRASWTWQESIHLPTGDTDDERVALLAGCGAGEHEVVIASLHLTHLGDADALRRHQLTALLEHPAWDRPGALRLLCGDFNTTADGPVLAPYLHGAERVRLMDASTLGCDQGPRGTLPSHPERCTDYILALRGDQAALPRVREARVVLNRRAPGTEIYPSDHFGVLATFRGARRVVGRGSGTPSLARSEPDRREPVAGR